MSDDIFAVVGAVSKDLLANGFTDAAVSEALRRIGTALRVDRAYIFENGRGAAAELTASQRFEWSAATVTPQIDNPDLQELPYASLAADWPEMLANDRVICGAPHTMSAETRELLEAQEIKSLLVCPIIISGVWWGFVGFDDCHNERSWSDEEVSVLRMLARAFGGTLRHGKMKQGLQEARNQLRSVAEYCSRS